MRERDPFGLNELAPHERLCHAIIVQACKDYRSAMRTGNLGQQLVIEKFFRSEWYRALSSIDGEVLIEKLRKEYHNENHQALSRNRHPH